MSEYNVTYIQYHSYTVEADSEDEAVDMAYEMFETDMRCPIASTWYDDIEVECVDDE